MDNSGNDPNISDASSGAGLSSSLELQSEPNSGSEDNEAPLDSPIDDKAWDVPMMRLYTQILIVTSPPLSPPLILTKISVMEKLSQSALAL